MYIGKHSVMPMRSKSRIKLGVNEIVDINVIDKECITLIFSLNHCLINFYWTVYYLNFILIKFTQSSRSVFIKGLMVRY